ncbi:putative malate dehydrogenase 1B isoform X2 [Pteropus medius]|uniref:putative malate dehydrogenase 1B isoform X2 n=1 Tax=Pteropus vampyrus TaxID=132908 RepID=UPI00196A60F2|nr:putative malate dehydrogenase 1B isoform X2 [Pteropus giganteus]
MYDPVPQLKLSCWAPDPRAQLECACAKPLATWLPGNRGLAAPGVGEYSFTMTKFVLAGRADCPFYAKAELLADYLQKNLPDFRVHKITQHPHVWEEWLEDLCKKNKWNHKNSPIIWRELLDRGGKGLLLGGYNEFLEHAQLYYGVTSSMTTEMMKVIAQENLMTHIEDEQEKEALKQLIEPLNVWITSASSRPCYNLIPILTSGEVFGMHTEISITLFDDEKTEENLQILVTEMWDLVSPLLQSVSICTRVEEAFLQAHVIIILDDHTDKEVYTLEDCIRSRVPLCRLYGYLIEKNAHDSVRVIVGGKTFVNLKTVLLMRYAPNITHNIIAVALGVEGEAKAALARKLKTTSSCIKDVIIWGNISGNSYVDLRKAKIYNYESAIWGPPHFSRPVLSLIFDSEWVNKEFVATLEELTATGKQFGAILAAHSIATTLKYWYHGSPPGEIVSLGVLSEGQFGIPEGIVFSMPVKFENGTWVVLTDLKDIEISEQIMTRMTSDLIQEKLVALGDLIYFQPYQSETLSTKRNKKTTLSTTNDNQEVQSISDEHKDSIHSSVLQEEEKDLVMSDVDFADLISETNPEQLLSQEPINEPEGKTMEQ